MSYHIQLWDTVELLNDNHSKTHIMLFYFRIGWYREFDLHIVYRMIASQSCFVVLHCVKARLEMCSVSARSGTQAGDSTVRSAVAVVSELRGGQLSRWVKVGSTCGAALAGSTAGPCPLSRCRDWGQRTPYSFLDCRRQSYSFWLVARQITPCR